MNGRENNIKKCGLLSDAFSALLIFGPLGRQEGHLDRKNYCFRTPWDIVMVVNVNGRCTLYKGLLKSFNLTCVDAQD